MHILKCLAIYLIVVQATIVSDQTCSRHRQLAKHRFYALRHCQRSNRTIIGLINVKNVGECAEYARKKRGMAFNFGPKDRNETNLFDALKAQQSAKSNRSSVPPKGTDTITTDPEEFFNCQVLECPEYRNLSTIVNDTRFDYYSLYTREPQNATCLPSVGMFVMDDRKLNYSLAFNECRSMGGSLAHVASEARTNQITKMLIKEMSKRNITTSNKTMDGAYVGLNETIRGAFFTSGNEPLECFLYRAWAPGNPSKTRQPGCVAITPNSSWIVQNCNKPLRFICELHTTGPPRYKPSLK
ncbi:AAEL009338-PB, partial [Aedes aegypti]